MNSMPARSVSSFVGRVRVEVRPRSSSDGSPVAGIHAQKLPGKHRLPQAPVSLAVQGRERSALVSTAKWSRWRSDERVAGRCQVPARPVAGVVRIDDGIDEGAAARRTGSNAGSR